MDASSYSVKQEQYVILLGTVVINREVDERFLLEVAAVSGIILGRVGELLNGSLLALKVVHKILIRDLVSGIGYGSLIGNELNGFGCRLGRGRRCCGNLCGCRRLSSRLCCVGCHGVFLLIGCFGSRLLCPRFV